jgi:hypothetical protein
MSCKKVTGDGTVQNNAGPPMTISGKFTSVVYTDCTVTQPAKCQIKEGKIIIENLVTATFHNGAGEKERGVKLSAEGGGNLTTITLENKGAEVCPLPGAFPLKGTAIGRIKGATIYFENGEDELLFFGNILDLEGAITVSARLNSTQTFTLLTATTTAS